MWVIQRRYISIKMLQKYFKNMDIVCYFLHVTRKFYLIF